MTGVKFRAMSREVSLSANAVKTALQVVAATNHRVEIETVDISFKGAVVTDTPVLCQVIRQNTAGTSTAGTADTDLSKDNSADDEGLQTTVNRNASIEPTSGAMIDQFEVHPQAGRRYHADYKVPGGTRLGFAFLAAQSQIVMVSVRGNE